MRPLRLTILCAAMLPLLAGPDPFVGTWKLDNGKSKFTPGDPSFMFATIVIEPDGTGLKSTASAADGQGLASDFMFNSPLDGTPSKVVTVMAMRGSTAIDTVTLKRVDDHTITAIGTKDGKLVYTDKRVVSGDGKTMTVSRRGSTRDGRAYQSTIVLTRTR